MRAWRRVIGMFAVALGVAAVIAGGSAAAPRGGGTAAVSTVA